MPVEHWNNPRGPQSVCRDLAGFIPLLDGRTSRRIEATMVKPLSSAPLVEPQGCRWKQYGRDPAKLTLESGRASSHRSPPMLRDLANDADAWRFIYPSHDTPPRPLSAGIRMRIRSVARSVQHWVELQGATLTTAREAGTPTRHVCSNPLLDGMVPCEMAAISEARRPRSPAPNRGSPRPKYR